MAPFFIINFERGHTVLAERIYVVFLFLYSLEKLVFDLVFKRLDLKSDDSLFQSFGPK